MGGGGCSFLVCFLRVGDGGGLWDMLVVVPPNIFSNFAIVELGNLIFLFM